MKTMQLFMAAFFALALTSCDTGNNGVPEDAITGTDEGPAIDNGKTDHVNPETVMVTVESNPDGATIIVDDVDTGRDTPGEVEMTRDSCHTVALELSGHQRWQDTFCPDQDGSRVEADLPANVNPLEDFMFLQRQWRLDEGASCDVGTIGDVRVEAPSAEYDEWWGEGNYDAVAIGFCQENLPWPLVKVSETMIEINISEGTAEWHSTFEIGTSEISMTYTDITTNYTDTYTAL
ncbi:MAG TPA: PEGA domain-containing protein [Candidatus Bipolaricaulota bacterium]|nr:PEGA domain-containing protein [Candidatus Bipolaricaulota bacterium]